MKKQYLHLCAYPCDECAGPVIAGWLGVRENQISKETNLGQVRSGLHRLWSPANRGYRAGTAPSYDADGMGFGGQRSSYGC